MREPGDAVRETNPGIDEPGELAAHVVQGSEQGQRVLPPHSAIDVARGASGCARSSDTVWNELVDHGGGERVSHTLEVGARADHR